MKAAVIKGFNCWLVGLEADLTEGGGDYRVFILLLQCVPVLLWFI